MITTAKIPTSFHSSPLNFQTSFHGSPKNVGVMSHICHGSKRESLSLNRVAGKTGESGDLNILSLISSKSGESCLSCMNESCPMYE